MICFKFLGFGGGEICFGVYVVELMFGLVVVIAVFRV